MILAQKSYSTTEQKALVVLNNNLSENVQKIYRRLSSTQSSSSLCANAFGLGHTAGKNLTINKGIKQNSKLQIGYQKE